MKNRKFLGILGLALILSLFLAVFPAAPAMAVTVLDLDPATGKINDTIGVIGDGFTASTTTIEKYAEIYFAKDNKAVNTLISTDVKTYNLVSEQFIDETGYFEAAFSIPTRLSEGTVDANVTSGTYYIYVTVMSYNTTTDVTTPSNMIKAKATFTVTAAGALDALSPTSGPAGTNVMVSGSSFAVSSAIIFKFDSTTIPVKSGDSSTRSSGVFISTITIPSNATVGAHTISVTVSGATITATFTVTAGGTLDPLSPTTGPPGTEVMVSGYNFPPSTALVFKFDTTVLTPKTGSHTQTLGGGIFISTITIPAGATAGAHTITVTAGTGTASATFTVTAVASLDPLSPATGAAGTEVMISGYAFPASTALVFKLDGTTVLTPKAGTHTQTLGGGIFISTITIPAAAIAGAHTISVTAGTRTASATFTVTGEPPPTTPPPGDTPTIKVPNPPNTVGAPISLIGFDFTPGATVTFKYDTAVVATETAGSDGLVTTTFNVPPSTHGDHTITATDGTKSGTFTFTVESIAPEIPSPLIPAMGQAMKSPLLFDWKDVIDNSAPVTYNLEIATASTFAADAILIQKTGLTKSEYTLTEAEALRLSNAALTYYWREKAVDAAMNESGWTGAGVFTITKPFKFVGWPLYLTIGIGAVAVFFLGIWFGRRNAFNY